MIKHIWFILVVCLSLLLPGAAIANDFDGDGIDDVTSIEQGEDGNWTWTWIKSSDGMTDTLTKGSDGSYPCSGDYDGAVGTEPCHIDPQYFWTVLLSDDTESQLNFGVVNPMYIPGRDFDGDGDVDLGKSPVGCKKSNYACFRSRYRVNGALNVRESQDGGNSGGVDEPFQGTAPTFTGIYGSRFACYVTPDIDGDGDMDICEMNKRGRRNPKNMLLKCKDARTQTRVATVRLGKTNGCPLRLETAADADSVVIYTSKAKKGITTVSIVAPDGTKTTADIAAVGDVITGDWLDDMSDTEQVGVVADGQITIYNPVDESTTTASAPGSGFIVDTDDQIFGLRAERVTQTKEPRRLNSKTVCRIFYCSGPNKGQRR